jgi:hypothetical protein
MTLAEAFSVVDFERAVDKDNDGLVVVDKVALEVLLDFVRKELERKEA